MTHLVTSGDELANELAEYSPKRRAFCSIFFSFTSPQLLGEDLSARRLLIDRSRRQMGAKRRDSGGVGGAGGGGVD